MPGNQADPKLNREQKEALEAAQDPGELEGKRDVRNRGPFN